MNLRDIIKNLLGLTDEQMPDGDGLEGFSDEQIEQARSLSHEAFEAAKGARDLTAARTATEQVEAFAAEQKNRADAANFDSEIEALAGRVEATNDQDDDSGDAGDGNDDSNDDGADDGSGDDASDGVGDGQSGNDGGDTGGGADQGNPVSTVAASATEIVDELLKRVVASAKPAAAPKKKTTATPPPDAAPAAPAKPKVTITASGDVKGYSAGQEMKPEDLAEPFVAKMEAATNGRIKDKLPVGTLSVEYAEDRFLDHEDSVTRNTAKVAKIQELAQQQARESIAKILGGGSDLSVLTAEGGLCAPVNVRYEIFGVGTDARPLRDGLTVFGATRGGIQFNEPPVLADVDGAAAVYTEAQDASGEDYPKDCIRVDCGDLITVKISAISLCMEVGNFQRLTFPENFAEWWRLGKVAHARLAEETLWARLVTLAAGNRGISVSTSISGLGTTRNFLAAIARTTQQYRDRFRTGDEMVLRAFIPSWLVTMMQEDLTNQAPGDATIALAKSTIRRYLAAFNVVASFVLDGQRSQKNDSYVQATDAAVAGWPDSVLVIIAPEGALLFLDKGELNFGTEIRDFDQIRNNDSGAFMETLENVAHVGPQLVALRINGLCNNGFTGAPNPDLDLCAQDY